MYNDDVVFFSINTCVVNKNIFLIYFRVNIRILRKVKEVRVPFLPFTVAVCVVLKL